MPKGDWDDPKAISVDEYLHFAAEEPSYKALARRLNLNFSSMQWDLKKRGVYAHVGSLLTGKHNPGPKRPPAPLIEGAGPDVEPDIEAIKEAARARYEAKARRSEEKEDQHIRFSHGPICLFLVGDQHIGNSGTDIGRMFREQDLILDTPGSYVFQLGDTLDNFVVGKLVAENMKPALPIWEQWEMARHYLSRFGGKLVAAVSGNHEAWTLKMVGIDYSRDICPNGILYDADEIKTTIHVGESSYKLWARHKWRGSSIYSQTHGQERAARFDSADHDIYVGAHTHTGSVAREFILNQKRKMAIQTGSYKLVDDFARAVGFSAHDASTACALVLHEDGSYFACADIRAASNYMKTIYQTAA
jgi:hypothetical protein